MASIADQPPPPTGTTVAATVAATRARSSYKGAITCNQLLRQGLYEPTLAFLMRLVVMAFCWPAALGNFYACGHSLQSVLFAQLANSAPNAGPTPRTTRIMLDENGNGRTLSPITRQPAHKIRSLVTKYGLEELLAQADDFAAQWWTERSMLGHANAELMAAAHGQALVLNRHMVISHLLFKDSAAGLFMTYVHGVSTTGHCMLGERLRSRPVSDTAYVPHTGCLGYFDQIWASISKSVAQSKANDERAPSPKVQLIMATIGAIKQLFAANAGDVLTSKAQPRIRDSARPSGAKSGSGGGAAASADSSASSPPPLLFGVRVEDIASPPLCTEGLQKLLEFEPNEALSTACAAALARAELPLGEQVSTSAHITKFLAGRSADQLPTNTERLIVEWCGALRAGQLMPTLPSGSKSFKQPLVHGPVSRMIRWIVMQPEPSFYSLCTDNKDLSMLMYNMPPPARVLFGYQSLECAQSAADDITADSVQALCQELRAAAAFHAHTNAGSSCAGLGGAGEDDSLADDASSSASAHVSGPGKISRRAAAAASGNRSTTALLPPLSLPVVVCATVPKDPAVISLSLSTNASVLALLPPPATTQSCTSSTATTMAIDPPAPKKRTRAKKPAANKAARPEPSVATPIGGTADSRNVAAMLAAPLPDTDTLRSVAAMMATDSPASAIGYHSMYSDAAAANTPRPLSKQERRRARMEQWALLEAAIQSNWAFRAARGLSVFRQLYESVGSPFAAIASLPLACHEFAERLRWIVPAEHALLAQTIQRKMCSLDSLRMLFVNQAVGDARQSILEASTCIGVGDFCFPSQLSPPTPLACENITLLIDQADDLIGLDQCPRETLERALLGPGKKWTDAVILIQIFSALSPAAGPDNINRQMLVEIWPALAYAWSRLAFAWLEKWPLMTSGADSGDITQEHVRHCCTYWYNIQAQDVATPPARLPAPKRPNQAQQQHQQHQPAEPTATAPLFAGHLFVPQPPPPLPANSISVATGATTTTTTSTTSAVPTMLDQSWTLNTTASCMPVTWSFRPAEPIGAEPTCELPSVIDNDSTTHQLRQQTSRLSMSDSAATNSTGAVSAQSYSGSPVEVAMPLLAPIRMEKRVKKQQLAPMLLDPHAVACVPKPESNQLGFLYPRKSNPFDDVHASFALAPSSSDRSLIDSLWNACERSASTATM